MMFKTRGVASVLRATLLTAGLVLAAAGAGAAEPATSTTKRPAAKAVPAACTAKTGVERQICVQCDGVSTFKRIGCEQRVFWTTCKGKRLFNDPYCVTHQDKGPPQGA